MYNFLKLEICVGFRKREKIYVISLEWKQNIYNLLLFIMCLSPRYDMMVILCWSDSIVTQMVH